jgi:hypothetical protein
MGLKQGLICLLSCVTYGSVASARVFDMGKESFGAYLRGTYGNLSDGKAAFGYSSGSDLVFSKEVKNSPSYEFGFISHIWRARLKFGVELLAPSKMKDLAVQDLSGSDVYSLSSEWSVAIPKIGLEFSLDTQKQSRTYISADWGLGNLTVQNTYSFIEGQSAFPQMSDFREETKSSTTAISAALGLEFLAFDTTTLGLEAGYRWMNFTRIKHNQDVTSFQGSVSKGDPALTNSGETRSLDASGAFIGLQVRFWIN